MIETPGPPAGAAARLRLLDWVPALAFALSVLGGAYWAGGFTTMVSDHEKRIQQLEQQARETQEVRDRLTRIEAKVDALPRQGAER